MIYKLKIQHTYGRDNHCIKREHSSKSPGHSFVKKADIGLGSPARYGSAHIDLVSLLRVCKDLFIILFLFLLYFMKEGKINNKKQRRQQNVIRVVLATEDNTRS